MSRKLEVKVENEILGSLIGELIENDYKVRIEASGTALHIYAHEDDNNTPFGWVKFQSGNVSSVISDYSTNMEDYIEHTRALAKTYDD